MKQGLPLTTRKLARSRCMTSAATALALLATGATSNVVLADEEAIVEEVTVTGSRIVRSDLVATSPIAIIDRDAIDLTGATHVATFLNELPSVGVPTLNDTNSNFSSADTGVSQIDLRNLEVERTLILVNGRRHIGGVAGEPTVDVSMIPTALVERVEIVTGGASAVYGSEAMAGVINFIMKKDFEGVEFNARAGTSEDGGATEKDFSLTVGSNFSEDRGNATFHVEYSDRGVLRSNQRALSANDETNSSFGPKGHFFAPGFAAGGWTEDDTTGLFNKPFVNAEDGFNRNNSRLIRVPTERLQFNANINYKINDHVTFFSESTYSQLESRSNAEPSIVGQFISVGSVPNITVPIDNPFLPAELRSLILAADPNADHAIMFRRFEELGPRTSDVQRRTFRTALGFEGDIDENWSYEVYYQYGNNTQDQTNGGVYNTLNFLNGLNVESDGAGGFQCQDAVARSIGCVPINVFGAGTITGAALDWVNVSSQLTARMTQHVAGAHVTGTVAELPGGELGVAFGGEWRQEKSAFNPDSLAASGLTSGNVLAATAGEYDVYEIFGEAIVPIVSDAPFAKYLGLELAARYSDYSTVGTNWTYKVSGDWQPMEDLRVRGGYSTAVRAPNINELFDPGSETFRSFVDPCAFAGAGGASADGNTVYDTQTSEVQARCATITGAATLDPAGINITSAGGLEAGNINLEEEKAKTWTLGAVYSPSGVPGLNVTVDYFNIKITNAIGSFTAQETVDQCVRQPNFPNNPFCSLIQRNPSNGLIERINALQINAATRTTSGVDFTVDYAFDLGEGTLRLNAVGTYTGKYELTPFEGGTTVIDLGEVGFSKWKVNAAATYDWNKFRFGWSTRFIGAVNKDNDNLSSGRVGNFTYHDLQVRYTIDDESRYEIFAGIDNIFDKAPPLFGQGVNGDVTGTNTAADVYDAIRRSGYVGLKVKF